MCGCDCCKEQDVAVASRMGRVSRNLNKIKRRYVSAVASRMGRVSRNVLTLFDIPLYNVASRMGRVSRNPK